MLMEVEISSQLSRLTRISDYYKLCKRFGVGGWKEIRVLSYVGFRFIMGHYAQNV